MITEHILTKTIIFFFWFGYNFFYLIQFHFELIPPELAFIKRRLILDLLGAVSLKTFRKVRKQHPKYCVGNVIKQLVDTSAVHSWRYEHLGGFESTQETGVLLLLLRFSSALLTSQVLHITMI